MSTSTCPVPRLRVPASSEPPGPRRRQRTLLSHTGALRWRRRRQHAAAAAAAAAQALQLAESKRQAEIEQELRMARDIQQGLLLEAVPALKGWEISAISLPARELGGDLYDFLPLTEGQHGLMIGDVSGKGLPAALRMAVARTVFRHEARNFLLPARTLTRVNYSILRDIPHGMITMLYAQLDVAEGSVVFANAGHNYPLLIGGAVEELEATGLPLGVDSDADYQELTVQLGPGQSVLLYTDGVVEAENSQGEIYGFERLQGLVAAHRNLKPRAIIAAVLHALRGWAGEASTSDDVTMVVFRRRQRLFSDELRGIVDDVLGVESWAALGQHMPLPGLDAATDAWVACVPTLVAQAQTHYGRGLARELHSQLRLAVDDYS